MDKSLSFMFTMLVAISAVLALSSVSYASGTGAEIIEFTGGATRLFEAMRAPNFIRAVAVALLGILIVAGFGGYISGGWTAVLGGLLMLGGWMGADTISDTLFGTGMVF